ncbi:MAG: hypothetical protein AABX01_03750 [Candidatus Micrarchaeota archaeon]
MRILLLLFAFAVPLLLLSGCAAKRDLKTVACIAKKQPGENKCLEKLAIDTKDPRPCDKIRPFEEKNGTLSFPTKTSCYAQVAYWKGEQSVCNALPDIDESSECRHRFDLYIETARFIEDNSTSGN